MILCLRCGIKFYPSKFTKHINRKRKVCKPSYSECTYNEMIEDYESAYSKYK